MRRSWRRTIAARRRARGSWCTSSPTRSSSTTRARTASSPRGSRSRRATAASGATSASWTGTATARTPSRTARRTSCPRGRRRARRSRSPRSPTASPTCTSCRRRAGKPRLFSARPGLNMGAALSPDGSKIAATLSQDGNAEIYLLSTSGQVLKRLTNERGHRHLADVVARRLAHRLRQRSPRHPADLDDERRRLGPAASSRGAATTTRRRRGARARIRRKSPSPRATRRWQLDIFTINPDTGDTRASPRATAPTSTRAGRRTGAPSPTSVARRHLDLHRRRPHRAAGLQGQRARAAVVAVADEEVVAMRVAAIDVGTNTALLTIADGGEPRRGARRDRAARRGARPAPGGSKDEAIARTARGRRGVRARDRAARLRARGGRDHRGGAQGGQRRRLRGARRRRRWRPSAGAWRSSTASARRGCRGARWRRRFPSLVGPRTVVDIGGGSTELIVGERDGRGRDLAAHRLGAADRAHRRARSADGRRGARSSSPTVDDALVHAPAPRGALVGIAGTVTTLAAMAQRLDELRRRARARLAGCRAPSSTRSSTCSAARRSPTSGARRASSPSAPTSSSPARVILQRVMARAQAPTTASSAIAASAGAWSTKLGVAGPAASGSTGRSAARALRAAGRGAPSASRCAARWTTTAAPGSSPADSARRAASSPPALFHQRVEQHQARARDARQQASWLRGASARRRPCSRAARRAGGPTPASDDRPPVGAPVSRPCPKGISISRPCPDSVTQL